MSIDSICEIIQDVLGFQDMEVAKIIAIGALYNQTKEEFDSKVPGSVNSFIDGLSPDAQFGGKHLPFTIRLNGLFSDILIAISKNLLAAKGTSMLLGGDSKLIFFGSIISSVIDVLHQHIHFLKDEKKIVFRAMLECAVNGKFDSKHKSIYSVAIAEKDIYNNENVKNMQEAQVKKILEELVDNKLIVTIEENGSMFYNIVL